MRFVQFAAAHFKYFNMTKKRFVLRRFESWFRLFTKHFNEKCSSSRETFCTYDCVQKKKNFFDRWIRFAVWFVSNFIHLQVSNRDELKIKFNRHLNEKRYNFEKYHKFFLQFFQKWIWKRVLWKFQTVAHWFTNDFFDYVWFFSQKNTYNLILKWKSIVTNEKYHFRHFLFFIDELFKNTNLSFSNQRRIKFIAFSIEKTKNTELLRNEFVHLFVQFKRLQIETFLKTNDSKKKSVIISQMHSEIKKSKKLKMSKTIKTSTKSVKTIINISKIQMKSISKTFFYQNQRLFSTLNHCRRQHKTFRLIFFFWACFCLRIVRFRSN